jgi:hypothetical protein
LRPSSTTYNVSLVGQPLPSPQTVTNLFNQLHSQVYCDLIQELQ